MNLRGNVEPSVETKEVVESIEELRRRELFAPISAIAKKRGLPLAKLFGRDRHKSVCSAKAEAMLYLRRNCGMSYPELGQLFHRDHTSVMALLWSRYSPEQINGGPTAPQRLPEIPDLLPEGKVA